MSRPNQVLERTEALPLVPSKSTGNDDGKFDGTLRLASPDVRSAPVPGIAVIRQLTELSEILPDWISLFDSSGVRNPFAHPDWVFTWARHFVGQDQLFVVTVRNAKGVLVGVAPFYLYEHRAFPGFTCTQLRLIGTGRSANLTELPQILTMPGGGRKVIRDIVSFLLEHANLWDWTELLLAPDQGWFESQWISPGAMRLGSTAIHKGCRSAVVLPLPNSWDELRQGLKRNVKESIRRGNNRLTHEQLSWEIVAPNDKASFTRNLEHLIRMHGERARLTNKVPHLDHLNGRLKSSRFLAEVTERLFFAGHVTPYVLEVAGTPVAGRLLLHANGSSYFFLSGFDPAWWEYNVATTLTALCLQQCILRGDTEANLSIGPDVAKLRWSEQMSIYHEWFLVSPRRRSQRLFTLFWPLHASRELSREKQRHRQSASASDAG